MKKLAIEEDKFGPPPRPGKTQLGPATHKQRLQLAEQALALSLHRQAQLALELHQAQLEVQALHQNLELIFPKTRYPDLWAIIKNSKLAPALRAHLPSLGHSPPGGGARKKEAPNDH